MSVRPTDWERIERVLPHVRTAILYGPPGTGKTTTALAGRERDDVVVMPCHEDMTVAEVLGHWIPAGHGRFVWNDGYAMIAWRHGKRLVADELDLVQGPVMSIFRAILNDASVARVSIPNASLAGMSDEELIACIESGEGMQTLEPAEGFDVVCTMNGELTDLDRPLQERFDATFYVGEPHPNAIRSLPEGLRAVAKRTACEANDARRISVRSWKKFVNLALKVGHEDAAYATFGERHAVVVDALRIGGVDLDAMFNRRRTSITTTRVASDDQIEDLAPGAEGREGKLASETRGKLRQIAADLGLPQGPNKAALVRRLANRGVEVAPDGTYTVGAAATYTVGAAA